MLSQIRIRRHRFWHEQERSEHKQHTLTLLIDSDVINISILFHWWERGQTGESLFEETKCSIVAYFRNYLALTEWDWKFHVARCSLYCLSLRSIIWIYGDKIYLSCLIVVGYLTSIRKRIFLVWFLKSIFQITND